MASVFSAVFDEFDEELGAISSLVEAFSDPKNASPKARIAAANAATLLLSATFEEYIRELARSYARAVVASCAKLEDLPNKISVIAWKRTLGALADTSPNPWDGDSLQLLSRFNSIYDFCVKGNLRQDIYDELIHNDKNMRADQINSLFGLSGLSNVCRRVCDVDEIKNFVNENDSNRAHGALTRLIDDFISRRNTTMHAINSMKSSGSGQISRDIDLLRALGLSLSRLLEVNAPSPLEVA